MSHDARPTRSGSNLRALLIIVLGLPLLPSGCLATAGTRYWFLSRQEATTLTPAEVAQLEDLPRFVEVHGRAQSAPLQATTDNNLLFQVEGYPEVVFVASHADDRNATTALLSGDRFDGRLYTADDYGSLAVNQFGKRAGMKDARVVRVGETPESQLWHVKLTFGIAGGIMALALALTGWILANRSRFTATH